MLSALSLLLAPILVSASPIFLPSEPATCEASREVSREATPSEDELPRWQREPSGPFLDCYDNFRLAGFAPAGSKPARPHRDLRHRAVSGVGRLPLLRRDRLLLRGGSRRYRQFNVGTICIEDLVGSCPTMTCPSGQQAFYRITTGAGCKPDATCAWVEVSGVYSTGQADICDKLVDCSCWPGLSCGARVCVPMSGIPIQPKGCPNCP